MRGYFGYCGSVRHRLTDKSIASLVSPSLKDPAYDNQSAWSKGGRRLSQRGADLGFKVKDHYPFNYYSSLWIITCLLINYLFICSSVLQYKTQAVERVDCVCGETSEDPSYTVRSQNQNPNPRLKKSLTEHRHTNLRKGWIHAPQNAQQQCHTIHAVYRDSRGLDTISKKRLENRICEFF